MPYTIPNAVDAFDSKQSEIDKVDLDIVAAGARGDGVVSGLAVTAQGTPNMTVAVAAGLIKQGGLGRVVAAANATITSAHATLPRFDLISISNAGAIVVTAGTAAASPVFPALPVNSSLTNIALAVVYVPAAVTSILSTYIIDKRVTVIPQFFIPKTADETVNNSTALQDDDELKVQLGASDVWAFELALFLTNASATSDYKIAFTVPAGATMVWGPHLDNGSPCWDSGLTTSTPVTPKTEATTHTFGGRAGDSFLFLRGVIIMSSTAGTVQLQWAQNTQTVENTKVRKGSYLRAWKAT